jgi:hypothetical protein
MTTEARGTFEITLEPHPPYHTGEGVSVGRITIDKQFQGDLQASSVVEMLSVGTSVQGSAGYVAVERVTGTLHGRAGGFVLQHSGKMARGKAELGVTVVPDSGSGALAGIAGTMTIEITGGQHFYRFDYTLDAGV